MDEAEDVYNQSMAVKAKDQDRSPIFGVKQGKSSGIVHQSTGKSDVLVRGNRASMGNGDNINSDGHFSEYANVLESPGRKVNQLKSSSREAIDD